MPQLQGNQWEYAAVTFNSNYKQYTVVLESITSDATNANAIAIDDIDLKPGACPPKGNCNFENGFCAWSNSKDGGKRENVCSLCIIYAMNV